MESEASTSSQLPPNTRKPSFSPSPQKDRQALCRLTQRYQPTLAFLWSWFSLQPGIISFEQIPWRISGKNIFYLSPSINPCRSWAPNSLLWVDTQGSSSPVPPPPPLTSSSCSDSLQFPQMNLYPTEPCKFSHNPKFTFPSFPFVMLSSSVGSILWSLIERGCLIRGRECLRRNYSTSLLHFQCRITDLRLLLFMRTN